MENSSDTTDLTVIAPILDGMEPILTVVGVVAVLALTGAVWMAFLVLRGRK